MTALLVGVAVWLVLSVAAGLFLGAVIRGPIFPDRPAAPRRDTSDVGPDPEPTDERGQRSGPPHPTDDIAPRIAPGGRP